MKGGRCVISDEYDISRESVELLQRYLNNPSKDYALGRQQMMRDIRSEVHSSFYGNSEVDSFDELDLSFLQNG